MGIMSDPLKRAKGYLINYYNHYIQIMAITED